MWKAKKKAKAYTDAKPDYQGNFDIPDLIGEVNKGFLNAAEVCMRMFSSIGRVHGEVFEHKHLEGIKVTTSALSSQRGKTDGPVQNWDNGPAAPSDPAMRPETEEARQGIYWHTNV